MLQMGSTRLHGINRGADTTTDYALEIAAIAVRWHSTADMAIVDRFDGLAVFSSAFAFDPSFEGSVNGIHFRSALCGYGGTGVIAASMILELFGFGDQKEILERICVGGDTAYYELTRERVPSWV